MLRVTHGRALCMLRREATWAKYISAGLHSSKSLVVNDAEMDTESFLLTRSEPFAVSGRFFHPAVIRTIRSFRLENGDSSNENLKRICNWTETMLKYVEKKAHKLKLNKRYKPELYLPEKLETHRRDAGKLASNTIVGSTDAEVRVLAACMTVLMPRSVPDWIELDNRIGSVAVDLSLDTIVLWAHAVSQAKDKLSMFNTRMRVVRVAAARLAVRTDLVVPDIAGDEVFAAIGNGKVSDSVSVERAGLYLQVLASDTKQSGENITQQGVSDSTHSSSNNKALENISAHCAEILSSSVCPIKLSALRPLWEAAPKVNLPNAYDMYKALYEQIFYSVSTEPLQLVNQEEAVTTLLESMRKSQFKNTRLINEICSILNTRGFELAKYGVRLFRVLVELDSVPFAMKILDQLLSKENVLLPERPLADVLSDTAKSCVFDALSRRTQTLYRSSDLTLALYCFGREDKKSKYYRKLEEVEVEIVAQVPAMKLSEITSILNSYAFSYRKYPDMMKALDAAISANAEQMNIVQISKILWAHARLNHQTTYGARIAQRFIDSFAGISELSVQGVNNLTKVLWSMAVLRVLTLEHYDSVERLLLKHARKYEGRDVQPFVRMQLNQVLTELRMIASQPQPQSQSNTTTDDDIIPPPPPPAVASASPTAATGKDDASSSRVVPAITAATASTAIGSTNRSSSSGSSSSTASMESSMKAGSRVIVRTNSNSFSSIFDRKPWETPNFRTNYDMQSSFTHKDASRVLYSMGVPHENEKALEHGIVVDIFIPPTATASAAASFTSKNKSKSASRKAGGPQGSGRNNNGRNKGNTLRNQNTFNNDDDAASLADDISGGEEGESSAPNILPSVPGWKGKVIEFDGPTHFETYMSAPLGSTAIKKRHLEAMGYAVASLPYWKYRLEYSQDEKQKALRKALFSMEEE